jgi:GxxExxY protein
MKEITALAYYICVASKHILWSFAQASNRKSTYCFLHSLYRSWLRVLEKVYENAMVIELTKRGIKVIKQRHIKVHYDGQEVGEFFADLLVEDRVIVEIKATEDIVAENEHQLVNYLKATDMEVGLLINFGKKPQFRRKIFENKLTKLR